MLVVFGRVEDAACAKYVLGDRVKATSLAALAGGGKVEGSKSDQAIVEPPLPLPQKKRSILAPIFR